MGFDEVLDLVVRGERLDGIAGVGGSRAGRVPVEGRPGAERALDDTTGVVAGENMDRRGVGECEVVDRLGQAYDGGGVGRPIPHGAAVGDRVEALGDVRGIDAVERR